ncbi:MAG TPA: S8 family serine peptidase, partial [Phototrophicaceae bacterium]|nr:S8 family serine peptidase [Phototrophicaceae bacterium]
NSVTLRINPNQVATLSNLPGVKRVDPDFVVYRDDTVSVPFIGADEVWGGSVGDYTGDDVIIAVIDTGIDYIHTDFGGSGDYDDNPDTTDGSDSIYFPADYPIAVAGDPKVIGGTDYVGDDYDSTGENGSPVPVPDDDPIDCAIENGGGHGSHVSGTAAGWGVNDDGTTYDGPYDDTIFTEFPLWTQAFRIGPGVAPEAALIALRVFGCEGSTSTSVVNNAIDDAVSGDQAGGLQADVINMSLGSPYGTQDPDYIENVIIKNASDAGTIVVMSAGNNGDFFFVTGSPGAANEGIAVASSVDPGNQGRGVELNDLSIPADTVFPAAYGASSPFIHPPLTAIFERPSPNPNGCSTDEDDFATFTPGHIALIDRGDCLFAIKQDNAFNAGASGVVVASIESSAPGLVTMAAATVPGYNIPTVHVTFDSGEVLRAAADGVNTITMDWTFATFSVEDADTLSGFSSRGTASASQGSFKPDLAAPGQSILSAGSGTGQYTYNISGTSMAS